MPRTVLVHWQAIKLIGEQITTIFRLEKEEKNKKNLVKVFQYLRAIKYKPVKAFCTISVRK